MRIEIVTDTFSPDINGVAMTLGRLETGLKSRGHRVHVVHTGARALPGDACVAAVPLPGYKEVRVGMPKPFELRERWRRRRPDAVYVATESLLGRSALTTARALRIPVATGFHTNFHHYMRQYGLGGLQPVAMKYLKNFHQRANCTLTPSMAIRDQLVGEGLQNVHLIGRGVDTGLFDPACRCDELRAAWGAGPKSPVAILVGRIAPEKNLELAMRTFGAMREAAPDLVCVIVGGGPLRAKLQGEHSWVRFAGVQTGADLARHYASADVLVFPSETETFGNVLLEAMASGLATVSYDCAASSLHVEDGVNGHKVPPGDVATFMARAVGALSCVAGSPLRGAARKTAEALGWDTVVGEFERRLAEIAGMPPPAGKINGKPAKFACRTVFLSDVHLGTPDSKADELAEFLKHIKCDKLVLNGDIIDGWALKRGSKWTSRHSRLVRKVIKMTERDGTEVIYLRGNHDEILDRFMPMALGKIRIAKEHVHVTPDGVRYLVVHGDGFDSVSTNHRWLAALGAVGYDFLLAVNRFYNHYRAWRGKEYFSLSKRVKASVKSAVSFVDRYEDLLQELARHKGCDGIICGHIHTPEDKRVGGVHYLNSGDWVESLTAIVEHHDGRMELVRHEAVIDRLRQGTFAAAGAGGGIHPFN